MSSIYNRRVIPFYANDIQRIKLHTLEQIERIQDKGEYLRHGQIPQDVGLKLD